MDGERGAYGREEYDLHGGLKNPATKEDAQKRPRQRRCCLVDAWQGIRSLARPNVVVRAMNGNQPVGGPLREPSRVAASGQSLGRRCAGARRIQGRATPSGTGSG